MNIIDYGVLIILCARGVAVLWVHGVARVSAAGAAVACGCIGAAASHLSKLPFLFGSPSFCVVIYKIVNRWGNCDEYLITACYY